MHRYFQIGYINTFFKKQFVIAGCVISSSESTNSYLDENLRLADCKCLVKGLFSLYHPLESLRPVAMVRPKSYLDMLLPMSWT